jgi:RNA recognition motif-containing protein
MNKKPVLNGKIILVSKHVSRRQNEIRGNRNDILTPIAQQMKKDFASNIFINFIPLDTTREEILRTFGTFGTILQEKIWKKEGTNF